MIRIDCKRMLGGRTTDIYVNPDYVAYIDLETVTVGLSTGKVIDTTTKSCKELLWRINESKPDFVQEGQNTH